MELEALADMLVLNTDRDFEKTDVDIVEGPYYLTDPAGNKLTDTAGNYLIAYSSRTLSTILLDAGADDLVLDAEENNG